MHHNLYGPWALCCAPAKLTSQFVLYIAWPLWYIVYYKELEDINNWRWVYGLEFWFLIRVQELGGLILLIYVTFFIDPSYKHFCQGFHSFYLSILFTSTSARRCHAHINTLIMPIRTTEKRKKKPRFCACGPTFLFLLNSLGIQMMLFLRGRLPFVFLLNLKLGYFVSFCKF